MITCESEEKQTLLEFEKKCAIAKNKFAAIRNGRWSKEKFGHDLSITVLRRLQSGTLVQTKISPRHDTTRTF